MSVVAYLAHPLGEKEDVFSNERSGNIANSIDWVRFLRYATQWAICYPAFVYLAAVDETYHHPRSLVDQIEIMSRCDVYVPVGGVMNPHMRIEMHHVKNRIGGPIPVVNLLYLGRIPPWDRREEVAKEIDRLARAAGL